MGATEGNSSPAGSKHPHVLMALMGIGVVAFFLRYLYLLATINVPTNASPIGDALGYLQWAGEISEGNWYGNESFYQAPLYPYFLATVMSVFGSGLFAIRVVQSILGAASVVFVGVASTRWFGNRVGILSAIGLALYPFSIYYDGIIQKASLGCFLICLCLMILSGLHRDRSLRRSFGLGLALGLLALTRENALLWFPILAIYVFVRDVPESDRQSTSAAESATDTPQNDAAQVDAAQADDSESGVKVTRFAELGLFFLGCACVLVPVAARNASLGGRWAPTTVQMGPNFYIGNNADATGIYRPLVPGHETPAFERADARRLAETASQRELSDAEVSKYWMDRAFDDIKASPAYWVQLMLEKVLITINWFEVPDVESASVYALYSPTLRVLMRLWHFGWLLPFAALGVVYGYRSELKRFPWVLIVLALTMLFAVAVFFILGRYRFPLVPLLMPLAAVGVLELVVRIVKRESLGKLGPIAFVVAFAICRMPVIDTVGLTSSSLMNAGVAAAQMGDIRQAILLFESSTAATPDLAEPHFNLGKAYLADGNNRDALKELLAAKSQMPSLAFLDRHLGEAYAKLGMLPQALAAYRSAAQADPTDQSALSMIDQIEVVLRNQSGGI